MQLTLSAWVALLNTEHSAYVLGIIANMIL